MITQTIPLLVPEGRHIEVIVSSCDETGYTRFDDRSYTSYTDPRKAFAAAESACAKGRSVIVRPTFNEGARKGSYRDWRSLNGNDFEEIWFHTEDDYASAKDTRTTTVLERSSAFLLKAWNWFKPVTFRYWDRQGKHGGITFQAVRRYEIVAANQAVFQVMYAAGCSPFHQMGERNEPGPHAWEQWAGKSRTEVEALLPKIEARYLEELKRIKEWCD